MSHIPPFLCRLSPRKGLVVFHRSGSRTRSCAPVVVDESLGLCVCLIAKQHEAGSCEEDDQCLEVVLSTQLVRFIRCPIR
jgi:hypothetical protein